MTIDPRFMNGIHGSLFKLLRHIETQGGFLTDAELPSLIALDRLRLVLVRCGNCRFLAAAQDAGCIMQAIEAAGDYVRDVSLPASDLVYKGDYTTSTTPPVPTHPAAGWRAEPRDLPGNGDDGEACRGGFNEADCGGAFDGFTVTSDADPGL